MSSLTPDRNVPATLRAEGDRAIVSDGDAWTRKLSALTAADVAEIDRMIRLMLDINGFGELYLEFANGKLKRIGIKADKIF